MMEGLFLLPSAVLEAGLKQLALSRPAVLGVIAFDVDDDELMLNVLRCHETY